MRVNEITSLREALDIRQVQGGYEVFDTETGRKAPTHLSTVQKVMLNLHVTESAQQQDLLRQEQMDQQLVLLQVIMRQQEQVNLQT